MQQLVRQMGLACVLVLLQICSPLANAADVDLLIKNARIIDGTGSPWFISDIAVNDGNIVALATNLEIEADQIVQEIGRAHV